MQRTYAFKRSSKRRNLSSNKHALDRIERSLKMRVEKRLRLVGLSPRIGVDVGTCRLKIACGSSGNHRRHPGDGPWRSSQSHGERVTCGKLRETSRFIAIAAPATNAQSIAIAVAERRSYRFHFLCAEPNVVHLSSPPLCPSHE